MRVFQKKFYGFVKLCDKKLEQVDLNNKIKSFV